MNFCDKIRRAHANLARSKILEKQNFLNKKFRVCVCVFVCVCVLFVYVHVYVCVFVYKKKKFIF